MNKMRTNKNAIDTEVFALILILVKIILMMQLVQITFNNTF